MKFGEWQVFNKGAVVLSRPRRHTETIGSFVLKPDRLFRAMASYVEVVEPPVGGVDSIGVIEGFEALRPWAARQKAIRAIRRAWKEARG